ncbi:MAG: helix-turn-helix transcriptional regulator [Cyclobacteriaceae bacterium]
MTVSKDPQIVLFGDDSDCQAALNHICYCCEVEKNLMISVYDLKKHKFLFFNDSFKNTLGDNHLENKPNSWDFWFQKINPDESKTIKSRINDFIRNCSPQKPPDAQFFTYHIRNIFNQWRLINHELSSYYYKNEFIALSYLYDISQKEQIENYLGVKASSGNPIACEISISKREKEVLQLIAEGFSSKQIAHELYISNHTAISHRKHLIEKFKVKNTAQLIKEAAKSILI